MSKILKQGLNLSATLGQCGAFSLIARRSYGSKGNFFLSKEFLEEISKKIDPVEKEFLEHRAINHPMFDYLKEQSKEGFTPAQFALYRDNFFCRTQLTISSISKTLGSAINYGDYEAAILAFKNLYDKMGGGNINKIHLVLLLESHNIHGMRVFSLDPVASINAATKSRLLLPEVDRYVKAKQHTFTRPYPFIAGNTWAHELAAGDMLEVFRKSFFVPYLGLYSEKEVGNVMNFFIAHNDHSLENGNVEKMHSELARKSIESACANSLINLQQVREGGLYFLNHQEKLWDGLLRALENARYVGDVVKPKPTVQTNSTISTENSNNSLSERPSSSVVQAKIDARTNSRSRDG